MSCLSTVLPGSFEHAQPKPRNVRTSRYARVKAERAGLSLIGTGLRRPRPGSTLAAHVSAEASMPPREANLGEWPHENAHRPPGSLPRRLVRIARRAFTRTQVLVPRGASTADRAPFVPDGRDCASDEPPWSITRATAKSAMNRVRLNAPRCWEGADAIVFRKPGQWERIGVGKAQPARRPERLEASSDRMMRTPKVIPWRAYVAPVARCLTASASVRSSHDLPTLQ
jgi:hypothetical protein